MALSSSRIIVVDSVAINRLLPLTSLLTTEIRIIYALQYELEVTIKIKPVSTIVFMDTILFSILLLIFTYKQAQRYCKKCAKKLCITRAKHPPLMGGVVDQI